MFIPKILPSTVPFSKIPRLGPCISLPGRSRGLFG
jgi:hypothetical protein